MMSKYLLIVENLHCLHLQQMATRDPTLVVVEPKIWKENISYQNQMMNQRKPKIFLFTKQDCLLQCQAQLEQYAVFRFYSPIKKI